MWCPSATLSAWANAWLAGKAAPDDVLDALSLWAPRQSVTAYDAVAADYTGLPWPDINHVGTVSLLQTLRTVTGHPGSINQLPGAIHVVLPVPGDVRGLSAGTQFERDAILAGETVIVTNPSDPTRAFGLVPEFEYDESEDPDDADSVAAHPLSWTVYTLPSAPVLDHPDLGDAEYTLRSAVRSAAEALSSIGLGSIGTGIGDPRSLVEQLLETARQHRTPQHAPARALRVLENAAHIDAIVAVSRDLMPIGTQSLSEAEIATDALWPLTTVVRSARMAAISAIIHSAWHD